MYGNAELKRASEPLDRSRVSSWPSACVLVATNLLPGYGVLALDWPVFQLLALFWMEVAVIGVVTALRLLYAPAPGILSRTIRLFALPFFCLGYGIVTLTYGLFLAVAFNYEGFLGLFHGSLGISSVALPATGPEFPAIVVNGLLGGALLLLEEAGRSWFALAAIGALAASHLFAFFRHYGHFGGFRDASLLAIGANPFGWLILLHVVVITGAAAAASGDSPVWALLLLICAKTVIDLAGHLREWSRLHPPLLSAQ